MARESNDTLFRHPRSEHTNGRHTAYMARTSSGDVLVVDGIAQSLDRQAAQFLRTEFSFTAPVPVLGRDCTIGLGDRLGLAAPGHIAAVRNYQATPYWATTMRELNLTGRTWRIF